MRPLPPPRDRYRLTPRGQDLIALLVSVTILAIAALALGGAWVGWWS